MSQGHSWGVQAFTPGVLLLEQPVGHRGYAEGSSFGSCWRLGDPCDGPVFKWQGGLAPRPVFSPGTAEGAPAPSPSPKTGESSRVPQVNRSTREGTGRALELARGCSIVHHDHLREATSALGRLAVELADVDTRLEMEGLRLAHEWHQLKVAINLGRLQHEHARTEAEELLAALREARDRALKEVGATDRRRDAAKAHEKELQASNALLEQGVRVRMAALAALTTGLSTSVARPCTPDDLLTLEAVELSLERERLEVMERQVVTAEEALDSR